MKFVHVKGLMSNFHSSPPSAFQERRAHFERTLYNAISSRGLRFYVGLQGQEVLWPVETAVELHSLRNEYGQTVPDMYMTYVYGITFDTDDEAQIEQVMNSLTEVLDDFPYTSWRFGERPQAPATTQPTTA